MKFTYHLLWFIIICLSSISAFAEDLKGKGEGEARQNVPGILLPRPDNHKAGRLLMLKTNALLWGATIMNIEGELELSRKVSLSLPLLYCPWFVAERHALRVAAVRPEGRWWFTAAGEGHFVGLHASLGWFNLKWGDYRYQDKGRPLLGAGVSYGYAFRLNRRWGLELSAGAGYLNLRYDRFFNTPHGRHIDLRETSYFGIDHLAAYIVYYIGL